MAQIDKRKLKVESLTIKSKKNPYRACNTCQHFDRDETSSMDGICLKWKFRVNNDELCERYTYFQLSSPIDELTNEEIDLVKGYQRASRGRGEPTRGLIFKEHYVPTLTEDDYKNGFIVRKFVQRKSDHRNPITEVGSYGNYSGKFYHHIDVGWKITGPAYDDLKSPSGVTLEKSCYNYNKHSIAYVAMKYPAIRSKVKNFIYLVNKKKY